MSASVALFIFLFLVCKQFNLRLLLFNFSIFYPLFRNIFDLCYFITTNLPLFYVSSECLHSLGMFAENYSF